MAINNRDGEVENILDGDEGMLKTRVCELISTIFFHGDFKAETANERELEQILKKLGYYFKSENELIKKLYPKPITPSHVLSIDDLAFRLKK